MTTKSTVPAFTPPMKATSNGIFQGDDPFDFALPLSIIQICLVIVFTRLLALVLRPFRQPRVVAEIVGGILLGPSSLGRNVAYLHKVFPPRSLTVLDTLANLGLLFFLFLVGLELDVKAIKHTGRRALCIALAGISLPFLMGIGTSFILMTTISQNVAGPPFLVFMGVALSITAFPVLARILADLKLLTTDVGRMAMSAAAVNDVAAWILLALAIALSGNGRSPFVSLWVLLCGVLFVVVCSLLLPRLFRWMARRCPEGEPVKETYVCATLAGVLVASFVTDLIGIHALFGAFMVGVLVPKEGPFAGTLVEKVEDLVSGLFLPLYFVSSGLKTNIATIHGAQSWGLLVLVICTACFGKIVGTLAITLAFKVPLPEALSLSFLMNTKGLVELIVLNIGKDRKVLNDQTFAIMVLMAIFTTFITTPLVMAVYRPARRKSRGNYTHRTILRDDANSQLRILMCFHSLRNIPSMINLIEASRGAEKREGLCVYTMHLMELSERPSAILMVHKARKNGLPFWNKGLGSSGNQVIVAFEAFRQLCQVTIRPMTAISAMSNIHEDICMSAERKRVAIIILPYHKHLRLDGSFETTRNEFRCVNKRVLETAPCSVGILVDRGLGGTSHIPAHNVSLTVTVVFFGGRDDQEALAYGKHMAEHPGISLVVVRIIPTSEAGHEIDEANVSADSSSVKHEERRVSCVEEAVEAIKEHGRSNLFVVGRKPEGLIVEMLNTKAECHELGPIGSLLSSSEFQTGASVLVVQKYAGANPVTLPLGGSGRLAEED